MAATPDTATTIYAPDTFRDAVAIVTGGGSGIGLATAEALARLGAKIAICGRSADKLDAAATGLRALAGDDGVHAAPCDIREPDQVDAFVDAVLARFGRIDILVNNAGGQFPAPAQNISPNGFAAVVRNNLNGTFNMTRAVAVKAMLPDRRGGRVVNVTANVYRGFPGMVHTGAARAGVENMTMTLAVEWSRFGVTINCVAPGVILSSGTERYGEAVIAHSIRNTPLRRAGTVQEVAAAILFLASPAAGFITGTTLRIDGGLSLHGEVFSLDPAEG